MVSDLLDNDDNTPDVAVHSTDIKLIPTNSEIKTRDCLSGCSQGIRIASKKSINNSNYAMRNIIDWKKNQMKSVHSRIGALQEEKEKIQKGIQYRSNNQA